MTNKKEPSEPRGMSLEQAYEMRRDEVIRKLTLELE